MAKAFQVTNTFQVTEEVSVEASSPDEAIRRAIEDMDESHRFVGADAAASPRPETQV